MLDTNEIGAFGFTVALTVYALLTILLLSGWHRSDQSRLPALATGVSIIWAGVWIAGFLDLTRDYALVTFAEWARGLAWLAATLAILREVTGTRVATRLKSAYGLIVLLLIVLPTAYFLFSAEEPPSTVAWVAGGYVLALLIVLAAEQLYRNAPVDAQFSISYLCIAVAGVFLFDLVMYGFVMAGKPSGPQFWASRGFVNALLAVPLTLGTWRRSHMSPAAQVPRQIAFYSFGITVVAIYVVLVVIGHRYISTYGGSWRSVGSVVLIVAAAVFAAVLLASARTRARVRVFLMKTFLQYKYDYRKEWLRFISTLSKSGLEDVEVTAVRAVAQIVNSPGGVVWIKDQDSQAYMPTGSWRGAISESPTIYGDDPLVRFLLDRQWVIDLEERKQHPERYANLELDDWLGDSNHWWLIVPVYLGKRLYGFIGLLKPRTVPELNFEDHDLLRTAGSHVGMHINQAESDKRLAESRQFGAYNRLTAFLMHDLNNLLAQQSLVVRNAERFRNNPDFVDDAIDTIAHSVSRMKRLMAQLSAGSKASRTRETSLNDVLARAVERCSGNEPQPSLNLGNASLRLNADSERLTSVFEHIIRNAQDATGSEGEVRIEIRVENDDAIVSIEDTGEGMSSEFIRKRLFRPFDSTKGSQSMGIGAYQAREYVRALGGRIEVTSEVGVGTEFRVRLPIAA